MVKFKLIFNLNLVRIKQLANSDFLPCPRFVNKARENRIIRIEHCMLLFPPSRMVAPIQNSVYSHTELCGGRPADNGKELFYVPLHSIQNKELYLLSGSASFPALLLPGQTTRWIGSYWAGPLSCGWQVRVFSPFQFHCGLRTFWIANEDFWISLQARCFLDII